MLKSATVLLTLIKVLLFLNAINCDPISNDISEPITKNPPFQVSIQLKNQFKIQRKKFQHQCFGTIINEEIVLTAAHCFHNSENPKLFSIKVGNNILNETSMNNRYYVTKIVKHEYFVPLQGYDIALMKLATKLPIDGTHIDMVDLNTEANIGKNQLGYAFGRNQEKTTKKEQQLILMPHITIDNQTCKKNKFVELTKLELCAVASQPFGPCDGDSGTALLDHDLKTQWGILSYTRSMCKPDRIFVFTRIHPFVNWIFNNVQKLVK